jgi:ABC-type transporter Mla MlaB component
MAARRATGGPRNGAAEEDFSIRAERRGPTVRITATGDLGPRASLRLHDEFYRALPSDASAIVVDLSAVTSVNRAAINTLAFMRRRSSGRVRIIPGDAVAAAVRALAGEIARGGGRPDES